MALAVLAEGGKGFVCCDSALEFSALSPRAHWNWGHVALRLILVPFPSRSLWPGPPASFRVDTGLTFLIPGERRCKEGVFGLESAWGMLGEGCLIKGVWPQAWGWSKNGLDRAGLGRGRQRAGRSEPRRGVPGGVRQRGVGGQRERSWTPGRHSGPSPSSALAGIRSSGVALLPLPLLDPQTVL